MLEGKENRLRPLAAPREEVTLVPYSGVQILDFGFDLDAIAAKPARFIERAAGEERALIPLSGEDERDAPVLAQATPGDDPYSIRPVAALEPFLEKWIPVPVLRLRSQRGPEGEELYDAGPSNWARLRMVELPAPDPETGHTHRVQLALDTTLLAQNAGPLYLAPDRSDAEKPREFRLVADPAHMDWFLRRLDTRADGTVVDLQLWVSDWLKECFLDFKRAEKPGKRFSEENLPHLFEHWARYLAYLRLIETAARPPRLRFLDTLSERDGATPVDVDLVLDVGNSRTCGILIERFPGEARVDLARSYPLEIRDLSRSEFHYSGLLASRVEFAELSFGDERHASRSGRRNAFLWPSFVRIGPEAARLVQGEEGTETVSGLSSPKRYLWDDAPAQQDWRFHAHHNPDTLPKSVRAAMRHLNEAGDVLARVAYEERKRLREPGRSSRTPAIRPRFSRSALCGFMRAALIAPALTQLNDPAGRARRAQADQPRRLRRIILSLPTATSAQEQAIIRSRAEGALELIWLILGIDGETSTTSARPELVVDWDEASCTQLVYLYGEVTRKFDGRIDTFLRLKGRERPGPNGGPPAPSLRLACIDIGGGTTDLMITTYRGEMNRVLHPEQTFREGFRVAGDDLVHRVVTAIILPLIEDSITAAGGRYVAEKMRALFGGDIGGQDQQVAQRRRQFSARVLAPLAEAALARCETSEDFARFDSSVAEVLGLAAADAAEGAGGLAPEAGARPAARPGQGTLDYVEKAAESLGAPGWRLAEVTLSIGREDVDAISREVFQKVLGNMCEVIDHLGVDVALLTGRPSRLPAVRAIVEELMVVPPHRLVSMHRYKAGRWYPYRDPVTHRIGDPKSTVAVGGMLIALSEGQIPNFKVTTAAFQMRSTARYLGEMDMNGQILAERVLFSGIDLDRRRAAAEQVATVAMFAPVHIGARQLPLERWTTTPLFRLDFANPQARRRPTPIRVELTKADFDDDDDHPSAEQVLRREALREAFAITGAEDGEGDAMKPSDLVLRLHTLGFEDDYWIDTGVFRF